MHEFKWSVKNIIRYNPCFWCLGKLFQILICLLLPFLILYNVQCLQCLQYSIHHKLFFGNVSEKRNCKNLAQGLLMILLILIVTYCVAGDAEWECKCFQVRAKLKLEYAVSVLLLEPNSHIDQVGPLDTQSWYISF
jgi:hypothetical protein